MSSSVPGGAIGVLLKWNSPSVAAHADSLGFCLQGRTMFTDRSICSKRWHQYDIGNAAGSNAVVDLKQDLYV